MARTPSKDNNFMYKRSNSRTPSRTPFPKGFGRILVEIHEIDYDSLSDRLRNNTQQNQSRGNSPIRYNRQSRASNQYKETKMNYDSPGPFTLDKNSIYRFVDDRGNIVTGTCPIDHKPFYIDTFFKVQSIHFATDANRSEALNTPNITNNIQDEQSNIDYLPPINNNDSIHRNSWNAKTPFVAPTIQKPTHTPPITERKPSIPPTPERNTKKTIRMGRPMKNMLDHLDKI